MKRVEYSNGKESKVEEKTTVFDNVDALKEYTPNTHPGLQLKHIKDENEISTNVNFL